jgi:uncharacterized phage-associated protein
MTKEDKIPYVDFTIRSLLKWHNDFCKKDSNDLSTLKVLKLIFFVTAVDTHSDSQDSLLDTVFDNFYAMPYGHVESDVYSIIKESMIEGVSTNNKNTTIFSNMTCTLDKTISNKIENSINKLKELNPHLIELTSFDLVELSHSWYSWQYFYSLAQKQGLNSLEIENSVIKEEDKIFAL